MKPVVTWISEAAHPRDQPGHDAMCVMRIGYGELDRLCGYYGVRG